MLYSKWLEDHSPIDIWNGRFFTQTYPKYLQDALSSVPGAENLLIRQQRNEVDVMYKIYLEDKAQVERDLG